MTTTTTTTPQSLYSPPPPQLTLLQTQSPLEIQIGKYRRTVEGVLGEGYGKVRGVVDKWIDVEHRVELRLKSLKAPTENMTPPILYIALSTLSTTILTSSLSRFSLRRFLLPPIVFVGTASYFLPKTSENVYEYAKSYETQRMKEIHETAVAHTQSSLGGAKDKWDEVTQAVGGKVGAGVDWVQGVSGLKVKDAFGLGKMEVKEDSSKKLI